MIRTQRNILSYAYILVLLLLLKGNVMGQNQPKLSEESVSIVDSTQQHSPRLATILSAALPGAGQFYNRKYWKIPIIYVAGGALVYAWQYNNKNYHAFKRAYSQIYTSGTATEGFEMYSPEQLKIIKDQYRRSRDLSLIGMTLLYVLNIVDATVDAHLFDYDIGDDLSLKVEPNLMVNQCNGVQHLGLNLRLRF